MQRYMVEVKEIHIARCYIEAESPEDAVMKVREGEGDFEKETLYHETMDSSYWFVKDAEGNEIEINLTKKVN